MRSARDMPRTPFLPPIRENWMWWFFTVNLQRMFSDLSAFYSHRSALWVLGNGVYFKVEGAGETGENQKWRTSLKLTWRFIFHVMRFSTLWVEFFSTDIRTIRLQSPASRAFEAWPQDAITALCFNFSSYKMIRSFLHLPGLTWKSRKEYVRNLF